MTTSASENPRVSSLFTRLVRMWSVPLVLGSILAFGWIKFVDQSDGSPALEADPQPSLVDGNRAYGYLKAICDIGPRIAGTEANAKQLTLVSDHFKKTGGTIRLQKFKTRHPLTGKPVEMVNLIGSWFLDRTDRVVLGAHYDTRPFPDMEPDPAKRRSPFLGANDGASGVALLMEIANHLEKSPTPWGIDLVLFDGEELIYEDENHNRFGEFFWGSKEFAKQYKADRKKPTYRYAAGFVLDMVGDIDLSIAVEPMSHKLAGNLVREVWGIAERLGIESFRQEMGREVLDDHLPLNDVGIPTIDIIDFDYPHWHTASDVPANCSGKSLADVGKVVTAWLNQPKAAKTRKR